MERSRNFYKTIRLGYILISVLIGCIAYNSFYEWQEIEALELDNKKIDEFRKEINNINIQMIKFSLFGETILEWNDKDIEHYHAQRMAMDSMLCRFKATYPAERIDSVRHLLEDKERQMCQIVLMVTAIFCSWAILLCSACLTQSSITSSAIAFIGCDYI